MTKEMKEEIKMFLIYMDLVINSNSDMLNGDGYVAIAQLTNDYPQFNNRRNEVVKIMEEIDKL